MSLYKKRYFNKFTEMLIKIDKDNAFEGMAIRHEEELRYLLYETAYTLGPEIPRKQMLVSMQEFLINTRNLSGMTE